MNYEPNDIIWKIGDLVLHDMDLKDKKMLMCVEGYMANDLYITKYWYPQTHYCRLCGHKKEERNEKTYKNDKKYLHDPRRFGIDPDKL